MTVLINNKSISYKVFSCSIVINGTILISTSTLTLFNETQIEFEIVYTFTMHSHNKQFHCSSMTNFQIDELIF